MHLSFKTKLSYGIGGFTDNAMFTLAGTFLLFYLTSVVGIAPAAAGLIVALGSIWEVICGPIVGTMSDNLDSRYGKRKPFLIAGAFPVAIFSTLLFVTIDASPAFKFIYYLVMTLMFWQSFSTFFVPYMAWGSELTDDYDERTILRSYAYVFNDLGMACGTVLPSIMVDILMNSGFSRQHSWTVVGMTLGITGAIALLICSLTIHVSDRPNFVKNPEAPSITSYISPRFIVNMLKDYAKLLTIKPVAHIIITTLIYLVANIFYSSARVYYYTYNVGFSAQAVSGLLAVVAFGGIALSPVIAGICNRYDKKNVFTALMLLSGVLNVGFRFVNIDSFFMAALQCMAFVAGNTSYWQLMPSLLYDLCEVEELYSGEKRSGQVISLQALCESFSQAIASAALGFILQMAGFSESLATQSDTTLTWINNSFTILPGIVMIITAFCLYRYPVNKNRFNAVMEALEKRNNGKEVSMDDFTDIYGPMTSQPK